MERLSTGSGTVGGHRRPRTKATDSGPTLRTSRVAWAVAAAVVIVTVGAYVVSASAGSSHSGSAHGALAGEQTPSTLATPAPQDERATGHEMAISEADLPDAHGHSALAVAAEAEGVVEPPMIDDGHGGHEAPAGAHEAPVTVQEAPPTVQETPSTVQEDAASTHGAPAAVHEEAETSAALHGAEAEGGVNWYVIGGALALVAAAVAVVSGVKERLAQNLAAMVPATDGATAGAAGAAGDGVARGGVA